MAHKEPFHFYQWSSKHIFVGSIYRMHWLQFWAQLQCSDDCKDQIHEACKLLEISVTQFLASNGWSFVYRSNPSSKSRNKFNFWVCFLVFLCRPMFLIEESSSRNYFPLSNKRSASQQTLHFIQIITLFV